MKNHFWNRASCLLILTVFIGTLLYTPNFHISSPTSRNETDSITKEEEPIWKFDETTPNAQNYITNKSGTKENVDITVHQAIRDENIKSIDQDSNSYSIAAPNATDFNVSKSSIQINNLTPKNTTLIMQPTRPDAGIQWDTGSSRTLVGFTSKVSSFLTNVTLYLRNESSPYNNRLYLYLYPAVNSGGNPVPGDYNNDRRDLGYISGVSDTIGEWVTYTFTLSSTHFLDVDDTYENTWYFGFQDWSSFYEGGDVSIGYFSDTWQDGDSHDAFQWSSGWNSISRDYHVDIGLSLNKSSITPEEINLKLNDKKVYNNTESPNHNSGFWNHTGYGSSGLNELDLQFSSDWYKFSLDVNLTQINYTKSLQANTSYTVESINDVYWESIGNLTLFDYRLDNNTVNFTIPKHWTVNSLVRDGTTLSPTIESGTTTKNLTLFGTPAIDGNYTLLTTSSNYITGLNADVTSRSDTSYVYANETVDFDASFSQELSGNINLTVYAPSGDDNYTAVEAISSNPQNNIGSWTPQSSIDTYGTFTAQVYWENATDISIREMPLNVAGPANYTLFLTNNTEYLDTADPFNITFTYEDTWQHENITGATIGYNHSGSWEINTTQANTDNKYNITVDPSDFSEDLGEHWIKITLNKSYYMNFTFYYGFSVVNATTITEVPGETDISGIIFAQNATYSLDYEYDQAGTPTEITGASISKISLDEDLAWDFQDQGGGNYHIRINTSQIDLTQTTYSCSFEISRTNYETQLINFDITVIPAQTAIESLTNNNSIIKRMSELNASFEFTVRDTDNDVLIPNIPSANFTVYNITGIKEIWDTDGVFNWSVEEIVGQPGHYELNVSLEDPNQDPGNLQRLNMGNYSILLNVSYFPNYEWSTLEIGFYMQGNTTSISIDRIFDAAGLTAEQYSLTTSGNTLVGVDNEYEIYQTASTADIYLGIQFDVIDEDDSNVELTDATAYIEATRDGTTEITIARALAYSLNDDYYYFGLSFQDSIASNKYNITLVFELFNYMNATFSFNLTIKDIDTTAHLIDVYQPQPNATVHYYSANSTYEIYANYNVEISANYTDDRYNSLITNALYAELQFEGEASNRTRTLESSGKYNWTINAADLEVGTYLIRIYFGKNDYENATLSFYLRIINLTTSIADHFDITQPDLNSTSLAEISPDEYQVYLAYDLVVNASFFDSNNTVSITNAWGVLEYNNQNYTDPLYNSDSLMYGWVIPKEDLSTDATTITLYFGKYEYNNASTSFTIILKIVNTTTTFQYILQPDHPGHEDSLLPYGAANNNYTAYRAYNISIGFSVNNSINSNEALSEGTFELFYDGTFISDYTFDQGIFTWNLTSDLFDLGTFEVEINFTNPFFENQTYRFNISLYDLETDLLNFIIQQTGLNGTTLVGGGNDPYEAYLTYDIQVRGSYWDQNNSEYIDPTIAYLEYNGQNYTNPTFGGDIYTWTIPLSDLINNPNQQVKIYFQELYYTNITYTFEINVNIISTAQSFDSITQPDHSPYGSDQLIETTPLNYSAYRAYNITFEMLYINQIKAGSGITDALAVMTFRGTDYTGVHVGGGLYQWNITSQMMGLDTYDVDVAFNRTGYQNLTYGFQVNIKDLETSISMEVRQPDHNSTILSEPYIIFKPFGVVVNTTYSDLNNTESVSIAEVELIYNAAIIPLDYTSNGQYGWIIPYDQLELDTLQVSIFVGKRYYQNQTTAFDLDVRNLPTNYAFEYIRQPDHTGYATDQLPYEGETTGYFGFSQYDVIINVTFVDPTNGSTPIVGATAELFMDGILTTTGILHNGFYGFIIPRSEFTVDTFNITINLTKAFHLNQTGYSFNLTISDLPTVTDLSNIEIRQPKRGDPENLDLINGNYQGFVFYDLFLNLSYVDTNNSAFINPVQIANITYNGHEIEPYSYASNKYGWNIPSEWLIDGINTITIEFNAQYYEANTTIISVELKLFDTTVTFNSIRQDEYTNNPDLDLYEGQLNWYLGYDAFDLTVNATYTNLDYWGGIDISEQNIYASFALISLNETAPNQTSNYFSGTQHGFLIPASMLYPGDYEVRIFFGKSGYSNYTYTFNLTIQVLTTDLNFEDTDIYYPDWDGYIGTPLAKVGNNQYESYIFYNITIEIQYYDLVEEEGLLDADTAELWYNGTLFTGISIGTEGYYQFKIEAKYLVYGNYALNITFAKDTYANATVDLWLNIIPLPTDLQMQGIQQPDHQSGDLSNIGGNEYQAYLPYDIHLVYSFEDTKNNEFITNAETTLLTFNSVDYIGILDGTNYVWTIPASILSIGTFTVEILLSLENYTQGTTSFQIIVSSVPTNLEIVDLYQPDQSDGNITFDAVNERYIAYSDFNLIINATYEDIVISEYIITGLTANLTYNGSSYIGNISSTTGIISWYIPNSELVEGIHIIEIEFQKSGFIAQTTNFTVKILPEASLNFVLESVPDDIVQGTPVNFVFRVFYERDGEIWPLANEPVTLSFNISNVDTITKNTNASGYVTFTVTFPEGEYRNTELTLSYNGETYGIASGDQAFSIQTRPLPGLPTWIIWLILLIVGGVSLVLVVKKQIIDPRKMHYTDMIRSSATVFEDAINLQNIIIMYKSMGTAIFFKSFSSEEIDPDLISGFLSAVQSFGKELKSQKSLNELSYGDKTLLFADGEYIRVTLVLGRSASPFLKRNLAEFVGRFETDYQEELKAWRGKIDQFQSASDLVDEVLRTSVILPHRMNWDEERIKHLKRSLSKKLLDIANEIITDERPFIFLAQLLEQGIENTDKEPGEIILSLDELLDLELLVPIKLEELQQQQEMSAEEIERLKNRIGSLPSKSDEEKSELFGQLRNLPLNEQEVILHSLEQNYQVAADEGPSPITQIRDIANEKEAKKELRLLKKKATKDMKEKNYKKAINKYEIAENISFQWQLSEIGDHFASLALEALVALHKDTLKDAKKTMKAAKKEKDFHTAIVATQNALDAANEMFKLGFVEYDAEIKRLSGIMQELHNKQENVQSDFQSIRKQDLIQARKKLEKRKKKIMKSDNWISKNQILIHLLIIANKLFKMGQETESSTVKQLTKEFEIHQHEFNELSEDELVQWKLKMQDLRKEKEIVLLQANNFEKAENYTEALAQYRKLLGIYAKLGDTENSISLVGKIDSLLHSIPNLSNYVTELENQYQALIEQEEIHEAKMIQEKIEFLKLALYIQIPEIPMD